ncbi:MAG TPA: M28 family peptidase [Blastocatellia bacterium]
MFDKEVDMRFLPRGLKGWLLLLARLGIIFAIIALLISFMIAMPGRSYSGQFQSLSGDEAEIRDNLKTRVETLAGKIGERNLHRYESLKASEEYIRSSLASLGYQVAEQSYSVEGKEVKNLEVEIKGASEEIILIGAHYDSVRGSPGANDNATGVAAMIELARLFKNETPAKTIRFVAFVNEEPPYFQTEEMGSLVYARRSKQRGERIAAMLSLETIGCYSEQPRSQFYPAGFSWFYPDRGNFIGFVGNLSSRSLTRRAIKTFRDTTLFPSEGVAAPGWMTGVGWSDQWSFWQEGYDAVMITDTAIFRYRHYHKSADTPDKIDYDRAARVVAGIIRVIGDLAR